MRSAILLTLALVFAACVEPAQSTTSQPLCSAEDQQNDTCPDLPQYTRQYGYAVVSTNYPQATPHEPWSVCFGDTCNAHFHVVLSDRTVEVTIVCTYTAASIECSWTAE